MLRQSDTRAKASRAFEPALFKERMIINDESNNRDIMMIIIINQLCEDLRTASLVQISERTGTSGKIESVYCHPKEKKEQHKVGSLPNQDLLHIVWSHTAPQKARMR